MKGIAAAIIAVVVMTVIGSPRVDASDCGANCPEHFTLSTDGGTVRYAQTEDITSAVKPVPYNSSWNWTTVQEGCFNITGGKNVQSSVPFNLLLRGAPTILSTTVATGGSYEIRLILGTSNTDPTPRVAAQEQRRFLGSYPVSHSVGGVIPDLAAGKYAYAMQVRLLSLGSADFTFNWITAQGVPNTFDANRVSYGTTQYTITPTWQGIGWPVTIYNSATVDLVLQGSYKIMAGQSDDVIEVGFSLDGASSGIQNGRSKIPAAGSLPQGVNIFDFKMAVPATSHSLQMWMRTARPHTGSPANATIQYVHLEHFDIPTSAPAGDRAFQPMIAPAIGTGQVIVGTAETRVPINKTMNPTLTCNPSLVQSGRWKLLAEFDIPANSTDYAPFSFVYQGYVEILGDLQGSPRAEYGIDVIHWKQTPTSAVKNGCYTTPGWSTYFDDAADHAMSPVHISTTPDGIYFFGDATAWGNWGGGQTVRLYMRSVDNQATFTVGKRFMSAKILPADGCVIKKNP